MTLNELAERGGVTARTVRYLIANDLVPASPGTGRGASAYGEDHLAAVLSCRRLIEAGLSVPAIAAMRAAGEDSVPLYADGRIELRLVRPDALDGMDAGDVPPLLERLGRALSDALPAARRGGSGDVTPSRDAEEPACP